MPVISKPKISNTYLYTRPSRLLLLVSYSLQRYFLSHQGNCKSGFQISLLQKITLISPKNKTRKTLTIWMLLAENMTNTGTGNNFQITATLPYAEWNFQIFTTPYVHFHIVLAKLNKPCLKFKHFKLCIKMLTNSDSIWSKRKVVLNFISN